MDNKNLEFNLPQDAYVNFDAVSLRAFMIKRLNEGGVFTDQNFEGSNISAILDILAYYTHVLMFYLNQTSAESMFSQSTIYENMNKIVKLIGYKPTGKQTSLTPIDCVASSNLAPGNYNIRKYSYFLVDNIQYTFNDDFSFDKVTSDDETIDSLAENAVLFQGTVGEYPIYTAEGVEYESFPIVVDNLVDSTDSRFISHGSISIYVKEVNTDTWYEYSEVESLFLAPPTDRVFDIRLNENGHYEVKFGNGVFGRRLDSGDQVVATYILSDGDAGLISKNTINGNKLFVYSSRQFEEIYNDVNDSTSIQIDGSNNTNLTFTNTANSTLVFEAETVDQIRENTPTFLSTQIRLVTESDYEKFLKKSIPTILNDVKVVDNDTFMQGYIQYFYDICVDPNRVNRVILNQVNFADPCDFNNVNIFCVPSFQLTSDNLYPDFLSNSFKNQIINLCKDKKMISNDVVPRDPIYMALDLGFDNNLQSKDVRDVTKLVVTREKNDKVNKDLLKQQVLNTLVGYFNPENIVLGQKIDISSITSSLLSIRGIRSIKTVNTSNNLIYDGLSFVAWNPVFEGADETLINQNTILEYFKFPYLYAPNALANKISIVDE